MGTEAGTDAAAAAGAHNKASDSQRHGIGHCDRGEPSLCLSGSVGGIWVCRARAERRQKGKRHLKHMLSEGEWNLISSPEKKKLVLFHSGSGPREMGRCLPSTTTVCANLHTIKTNMSLFWKIRRPFCWVRQPGEQRLRLSDIPLWQNIPGFLFSILVDFGSNMFRHASHWDFTCSHNKTLYHSECSVLDCLVKGLTTDKKWGLEIGGTCSRGGGRKNTHKLTCECCTHRNSITEQRVCAASCLLNHTHRKKCLPLWKSGKFLDSPTFLLAHHPAVVLVDMRLDVTQVAFLKW